MISKKATVGVIGSGTMGLGIAQVAAQSGHPVYIYDSNATQLQKAKQQLQTTFNKLVEKQKITADNAEHYFASVNFVEELASFAPCDLVIEAVVEDIAVKYDVFTKLEKIVSADCVLASNTSSLSITSLGAACEKPGRFLGIHFFNPAPLMPLVEIIPGIATQSSVLSNSKRLIDSWGKITVVAKDTPGFIVNRVARPYYGEAIRIYEEGIADFATIDWAMKTIGEFKMGPFELMDMIGNDINYKVTETVWTQLFFDPRYKPSLTQKRLYEAKYFGKKTGQGYYNYHVGATNKEPDKNENLAQRIFIRVLSMLVNEAADALYYGVATREDIDLAMTKGVNYPKGLLKWADEIGLDTILNQLEFLKAEYAEDRYRSSVLLKKLVRDKTRFYDHSIWHG